MKLLIVCPTIDGREDSFNRLLNSYHETIPPDVETILEKVNNRPTCGKGWSDGVERALASGFEPDYIHLTCDDLEAQPGWLEAAAEAVDERYQPAPHLDTVNQQGEFGTDINYGHPPTSDMSDWKTTRTSVIPFFAGSWWNLYIAPMFTAHYFTDDFISHQLGKNGIETKCRTGMKFFHHHHMHGRGAGMTQDERMIHDQRLFQRYLITGLLP